MYSQKIVLQETELSMMDGTVNRWDGSIAIDPDTQNVKLKGLSRITSRGGHHAQRLIGCYLTRRKKTN